jgi:CheY-like chemotaxis protein
MAAHILIVEDNPTNLSLMAYLLNAFGHHVTTAVDGLDALEKFQPRPPDLVLMDLQMPRMDGYTATRRLKDDPAFPAVPVVAVTAFAMVGDRDRVLQAGFDGYVSKPIDPETFVRDIDQFLPATLRSTGVHRPAAGADSQNSEEGGAR